MRLLLVGNPASGSGRGRRALRRVERDLRDAGASVGVLETESVGHARRALASPPSDVDRIVACGGDGLVSECAAALRGGDLPLAVIPAGRGNDFARALGVPLERRAAVVAALRPEVARCDLGLAGGRAFCTVAACGLDAEVSRRARTSPLPLPGAGVYVVELLRALARLRPAFVTVEADGKRLREDLLLLAVANTPTYGGGFRIAPRARLGDGLLDACAVRAVPRSRALALFPRVFTGRHLDLPEVTTFRCEELRIETDPPLAMEADGEPLAGTPVTIRVDRAALPVVAPALPGG